jgi:hypothetical protein
MTWHTIFFHRLKKLFVISFLEAFAVGSAVSHLFFFDDDNDNNNLPDVFGHSGDELMTLFLYFLPTIPALTNWFLGDIREEVKLTAETSQDKTSLAGSRSSHFKILFKSCFIFLQLYIFYTFIYQPLLYLLASW